MSTRRRFRIIKEIAEGGFGKVYLSEQISADGFSRIVAMKLLHAKWSTHDEIVMRTRDEARLLGLIRHQHIVKVEDLTSLDGKCAIIMEYLEGVDLKWMMQYLKDRNMEFPRAALFESILAVASALDAAYNSVPLQGALPLKVIHRDIKPSNIFITIPGAVKVLDFGTARANFAEREAKTQALAFGSQGYMAPERMLGEEDTPKADIFSLGISLYELLTLDSFGRIPPRPNKFAQKVDERVASVKLEGDPAWQNQVRQILRRMLAYEPLERPSAAEIVEVMEQLSQDAKDTGLRKFCRTLVSEAKAALPEVEAGDPLVGLTVEEDASSPFAGPADASLGAPPAPPSGMRSVEPGASSGGFRKGNGPSGSNFGAPPDSVPGRSGMSGPRSIGHSGPGASGPGSSGPLSGPRPTHDGDADIEETGGGFPFKTVAALFAVFVLVVVVGAVGLGTITALVVASDGPSTAEAVVPKPDPVVAQPKPDPQPAGPVGGVVEKPDARPDAKTKVTLRYADPIGAKVIVTGGTGFKGVWDGKQPWTVELGEGQFSTLVELPGGEKLRGIRFGVDPGKSSCDFSFDPAAKTWTGGCK